MIWFEMSYNQIFQKEISLKIEYNEITKEQINELDQTMPSLCSSD